MNKESVLKEIAEILEVDSLSGEETLQDLAGWDSIAVMSFVAMVDEKLDKTVSADRIASCRSVNDLVDLCLK